MTSLHPTIPLLPGQEQGLCLRPIKKATGVKPHNPALRPFRVSFPATEVEGAEYNRRKRDALRAIQGEARLSEDRLLEHVDLFRGEGFWDLELRLVNNKRSKENFCSSFAAAGGEISVLVESAAKRLKPAHNSFNHLHVALKAESYAEYKFSLASKLSQTNQTSKTLDATNDWRKLPIVHFKDFARRPQLTLASITNSSRNINTRTPIPTRNPLREKEYVRAAALAKRKQLTSRTPFHSPLLPPNSTFHPFFRLPAELRLKIWDLARPSPQIIRLQRRAQNNNGHIYSTTTVPGIVQANAESRHHSLTTFYPPRPRPTHLHPLPAPPPIYFSPTHDYLFRGCALCSSTLACLPCSQIPLPNALFPIAQNIMIHSFAGLNPTTFDLLCAEFPASRNVIVLAPYTPHTGFSISDLVPSPHRFDMVFGPFGIGSLLATYQFMHFVGSALLNIQPNPLHPLERLECMELAVTKATSDRFGFFKTTFESAFEDDELLRILETPIEGVSPNEVTDGRLRVVDGKVVIRKKRVLGLGYLAVHDASVPFNRGFGSSLFDASMQSGSTSTPKALAPMTESRFAQIKRRKNRSKLLPGKKNELIDEAWRVVFDREKAEQLLEAEKAAEEARVFKDKIEKIEKDALAERKRQSNPKVVLWKMWNGVRAKVVRIWESMRDRWM